MTRSGYATFMAHCRSVIFVLGLALGGCTPDLAEVETRQQALRREVDVLAEDIARMRSKMQEMGLMPSGPLPPDSGGPSRLADLGLTIRQEGSPPELPGLGPLERREGTPCGYRMRSAVLAELSDKHLVDTGSGIASPVVLAYEGRRLDAHAGPARFENGCSGAFRLQPRFLFLSPFAEGDVQGRWSVGLAPQQPVRRGDDGLGVFWVYPGTSLTFAFAEGWDASYGDFAVHLDGRVLRVGRAPKSSARVEVLGQTARVTGDRIAAPDVRPPDGPWSLVVVSPSDGPYVLVESLWVGNEDVGHVVSPVPEAS